MRVLEHIKAAAVELDTLANSSERVAEVRQRPVTANLQSELAWLVADRGAGVPAAQRCGVLQCRLDHPVADQVDAWGELDRLALGAQLTFQSVSASASARHGS